MYVRAVRTIVPRGWKQQMEATVSRIGYATKFNPLTLFSTSDPNKPGAFSNGTDSNQTGDGKPDPQDLAEQFFKKFHLNDPLTKIVVVFTSSNGTKVDVTMLDLLRW